jgi:threonine-phosphate decarboxylase
MKHGAGIYKVAKKLNCRYDEVIDFSSNINTYQPKTDIKLTNSILVRYGDSGYSKLKKEISKNYSIKKNQLKLYNGATAAIFELFKNLKEKNIYLYAPLYGEYEKAAKQSGKKIFKIDRFKNINTIPKKNSVVVFVNPSTPDGKFYKLFKLFKIWKKQNCTILLDESFIEFEKLKSFRDKIDNYKKLYIIQSFSKFYASAGVRVGAIFSNQKNIKKLKTPLWNLSSFDVEFLTKRLKDKSFLKQGRKVYKKDKKALYKVLRNSKKFEKIYRSDANFFLVKSQDSKKIFKHLLGYKILVRKCESFDFLSDKYLRFGVKNQKAIDKLEKALDELT